MLSRDTIDTRQVPAAERFGLWLDMVARTSVPLRIRTEHAHDFAAWAEVTELGPIRLLRYEYPSLDAQRNELLVRRSDPEHYLLALTIRGNSSLSQAGRYNAISAGEFTFYDTSRPHEVCHHGIGDDAASSIVALIPYSAVPLSQDRLVPLFAGRMSGSEGIGALLAQYLVQLTSHPEQYHDADASRLGGVGLDLVTTMLGRHLVAEDAVPTEVRRRALLAQVQSYIHQHLGDATLSPQVVADAHHISVRSLHRLFEAEQSTVAAYIRGLRLERCRRDLADPALHSRPIATIAARWGFADKAHFSRAFRAAHDTTPQDWRRRQSDSSRIVNRRASTVNPVRAD